MKKFLIFLLFLSGCMMGPDYTPPDPYIPDAWQFCEEIGEGDPINAWWCLFEDPLLNKYIELAYNNNNNIDIAEANILQSRAMLTVVASALYPQIYADFNASRTFFSKNGPLFQAPSFAGGINPQTGLPFIIQIPQLQTLYNALLTVNWNLDIWGKTRRSMQAAYYGYEAYIEQKNELIVTLLAEVASHYILIRGNQKKGALLEQNIALLEQELEIVNKQLAAGYRSCLDVQNIEALLLNAKAELPDIFSQIIQHIYALSVLTGSLPETFLCELLPMQPLPTFPECVAVGLRSDLLRRRPDVRQAERELAQATANIGVAVASFFPTITLSGDVGFQSLMLKNLFQAQSQTWSIQGDANAPIFDGCKLLGNLRISEAAAVGAIYNYQQTILNALQEAESALISYVQEKKTAKLYEETAKKYEQITETTERRFLGGLSNIVEFIQAERELVTAEENFVESETAALLDLINLYKALGGGWDPCY